MLSIKYGTENKFITSKKLRYFIALKIIYILSINVIIWGLKYYVIVYLN